MYCTSRQGVVYKEERADNSGHDDLKARSHWQAIIRTASTLPFAPRIMRENRFMLRKLSKRTRLGLTTALSLIALLGVTCADAQVAAQATTGTYVAPYYQTPYYGGGGWGGGYGGWGFNNGVGSTAFGSYAAGLGQAIRAQGQYNALTAEAAVNLEEAKKREIENRLRWTNAYYDMRKMNQDWVASQRAPKLSTDEWARLAKDAAPARLASNSLDPVSGHINWPTALQSSQFQEERATLDLLFAQRAATHGAVGLDAHRKIRATVDAMLSTLKSQIRELDSRSYLDARSFLNSLAYESDFPTG